MGSPSLSDLVRAAQTGDESAVSTLVEMHQKDLYRFCVYLTHTTVEAEDLMQDVFLKVLGSLRQIKEPQQFKFWLLRTAKNLFLDRVRAAKVRREASPEQVNEAWGDRPSSHPDLVLTLQTALAELAPEDRVLVLLIDQQGHSYEEAGQLLGLSEAAVTSRIYRVRQELREKMKELGKERGRSNVL